MSIGWRKLPVLRGGVVGVESRAAENRGCSLFAGWWVSVSVSPATVDLRTVWAQRECTRERQTQSEGDSARGRRGDRARKRGQRT